jgi:hypothetical protein
MNEKTWRFLGYAYLLIYIVSVASERRGLRVENTPTTLDKLFAAPIFWGLAVDGIRTGSVYGRFSTVERSDRPFTFWMSIATYCLIGLLFFAWGIHDLLRP